MKTYILIDNKQIGYIEDKTFYTPRNPKHYFYKFNGFGCSTSVLHELQKREVETICVIFRKSITQINELRAKVVNFYLHGNKYDDKGDTQLILDLKHWKGNTKYQAFLQSKL